MRHYLVWRNYKYDMEEADGAPLEAPSPEVAAVCFAEQLFSLFQHVDPGSVFVRDLETNEVTYWIVRAHVTVHASRCPMPPDFNEELKAYGAAQPSQQGDTNE